MILFSGVLFAIVIGFFWMGVSWAVNCDGWKRIVAFGAVVSGMIVLSITGVFDRVVQLVMGPH